MKSIFVFTSLLLNGLILLGQQSNETLLFETKSKSNLFYVELNNGQGRVFEMGAHVDKAGSGYSFKSIDTVTLQPHQAIPSYVGRKSTVVKDKEAVYLILQNKNSTKYVLGAAGNSAAVNSNLNNAYYLDRFISMTEEINTTYPLNHYSFRNAFSSWSSVDEKQMKHSEFKEYADRKISQTKDSVTALQEQYVSLTNRLIQNISINPYDSLKSGLEKLPVDVTTSGRYFATVVNEVARQNPEYFFRLAEDLPNRKEIIFNSVEKDKKVIAALKSTENHAVVKREFFRSRNFDKWMPLRIIGTAAVTALILVLLL
jgi:hypothetical protein